MKRNKGILHQMKKGKVTTTNSNQIDCLTMVDLMIELFGSYTMDYSKNEIDNIEDVITEVKHYQFLRKYNLV